MVEPTIKLSTYQAYTTLYQLPLNNGRIKHK